MELSEQMMDAIAFEVRKTKGWMKFMGIVMIVVGALQAITIVGIVFAWLPIWIGILLTQAAKFAEKFSAMKDVSALHQMLTKLRLFFLIQGIMIIIGIVASIIVIIVYVIFGLAMLGMMSQAGQF